MRAGWLLLLLAGCPLGPGAGGECQVDGDCDGNVCARDGLCHPASNVRLVRVTWTVNGAPATPMTCAPAPDLQISFLGFEAGEDPLGFAPVPCEAGQFVVDKLPRSYTQVELGREGSGFLDTRAIGTSELVEFDLRL